MITKDRLKELKRDCGIVYSIEYGEVKMYDLSDEDITLSPNIDYALRIYGCLGTDWFDIKEEDLFETKKDAEWYREFGNVTRTERLELPTWEEFKNTKMICFSGNKDIETTIYAFQYLKVSKLISLYDIYGSTSRGFEENWKATKENYILACRKCKELFLGESYENRN